MMLNEKNHPFFQTSIQIKHGDVILNGEAVSDFDIAPIKLKTSSSTSSVHPDLESTSESPDAGKSLTYIESPDQNKNCRVLYLEGATSTKSYRIVESLDEVEQTTTSDQEAGTYLTLQDLETTKPNIMEDSTKPELVNLDLVRNHDWSHTSGLIILSDFFHL